MSFVHLHTHSHYSLMQGTPGLETLCRGVKALGMERFALTDTNGLYGLVFFLQIAEELGIHPIVGAEIVKDEERAVCLVKNQTGYEHLCQMLTLRHCDKDFSLQKVLSQKHDGLVLLSDSESILASLKNRGDVHAELIPGKPWRKTMQFAKENHLPAVATGGVYFLRPWDYILHRLLRAIDLNTKLSRLDEREVSPESAWLKSTEEMQAHFPSCPEIVENTLQIADKCSFRPDLSSTLNQGFAGLDRDATLRQLQTKCEEGIRKRYSKNTPEIRKRLEYELSIIAEKGFSSVFLMMEDIVSQSQRTCGRGSAAASIVSYALGITHVDPIRHNLFFERFLNPGRKDPPDIDVDFPWDERDDIFDYVFQKYGEEKAAMVSNHVGFRLRAAVREVAKVMGMPDNEIKQVTDRLSHLWTWKTGETLESLVENHPVFRGLKLNPPWPDILKWAQSLKSRPRYLSVHCGGVVVVPDRLDKYVPSQRAPKGVRIIQWEKDQTEDGGLVKMDLLGNRSLAVIRDALEAVRKNTGEVVVYSDFNPIDDPVTCDLIRRGDTIGVFYIESPAMRQLQKKTDVGDYEHIVIHSSIIRPAANTYINAYVRRLKGEPYEPLHPILQDVLGETYGIMVYQEDVTKVAMQMAGFSAVEGDGLRKTLSKKRNAQKLSAYCEKFLKGAIQRGVPPETAQKVWEMILSFSGYSFCKPHSASYALVSYKSAWLRAHHPAEFMAAVISNQGGYYSAFAYMNECRRMRLKILPPDINKSQKVYTGREQEVRVGLMQLKGLKDKALDQLLQNREEEGLFRSFEHFVQRVKLDPADMRVLIKAGCFDQIAGTRSRAELLWQVYSRRQPKKKTSQMGFDLFNEEAVRVPHLGHYDFQTMLLHEVEVLGFPLSVHPLELYKDKLCGLHYIKAKDIPHYIGKKITTIGWWVTNKMVYTKNEEPMSFISFEDTTALYETVFFPDAFQKFCSQWTQVRPYILYGQVDDDLGAVSLHVEKMAFLDEQRQGGFSMLQAS